MMAENKLQREQIIKAVVNALEPFSYVHALWQGGAAAFGRVDQWSDIDFMVIADWESIPRVFETVETAIEKLVGFDLIFDVPQPTSHGFFQKFYRLRQASPFLLIDLAVGDLEKPDKFLEPEIHGNPIVHFDRKNIIASQPLDREKFKQNMLMALERAKVRLDIFQLFFDKEYNRGNYLDAFDFYFNFALSGLLAVLRMKHSPYHYTFRSKYANYDLPPEVVKRLEELYFVKGPEDLKAKYRQVKEWFAKAVLEVE
ncbi:MAG: hypothetical protein A2509_12370 [Candidatus Edwardsbacteria bacterium RIFOXYD12_FULL_50_11]|uniref:Polymerase nucleotidyl transferase domain-containing protein n=1 Tax=Candidatus Edwardsbacteria bacterium GWF2_54_11 TaxID=1817851 RepID=A0A1F5RIU9_9BACT|nr:MAG: hypothetical protein A2502_04890 [Candidatus Edwardsbacteria bacterium RifOxyC12_full_54_24]OGF08724.1 MAG: hypothetical protein A2273_07270 [Candidatus Edwardsbacteria bacterium RifOxyA12_full_54_48]OGF12317.1 MAG: hypothetical protein A3K15_00445 [Candidatus Edwardsbacteria bacterium GWE2_54_12]OGF14338.1 MAG: hypothetical protein A2024_10130 [Candidatus Edwardsbacteria bacterium GWF2_54_11]OGF15777.1 MAG: hypothetical protein A2509_12370 [Candidatus Edwardsbacteria bacterium RIFOXYD1